MIATKCRFWQILSQILWPGLCLSLFILSMLPICASADAQLCRQVLYGNFQSPSEDLSAPPQVATTQLQASFHHLSPSLREARMRALAQAVVDANRTILRRAYRAVEDRPKFSPSGDRVLHYPPDGFVAGQLSYDADSTSRYPVVAIFDQEFPIRSAFFMRTNGQVAFLYRTYLYRKRNKQQKFMAAFWDDGTIKTMDQGELILSSMPDQLTIARVMGAGERQAWQDGSFEKSRKYGAKTHFAPVHFQMKEGDKPVLIKMTKNELLELYRSGALEINTYDESLGDLRMAENPAGLEFELVFIGPAALEILKPRMRQAVTP